MCMSAEAIQRAFPLKIGIRSKNQVCNARAWNQNCRGGITEAVSSVVEVRGGSAKLIICNSFMLICLVKFLPLICCLEHFGKFYAMAMQKLWQSMHAC